MKKSLFALLVVIGILLMPMYCMADDDFGLEIVSGKYHGEEYGFDKFDLVVKNNTDININSIGITADIIDSNENILGQAYLASSSNVKPGQSITLEAYADHYEGAIKATANYGYYNDSNNNYYDGYFYDSLEVVFDTSVESVANKEGESSKSDSEDIDTLKKRIEELESENEELKNHSNDNTNIDLESMSVDELKELKTSIDNYLEVDTRNDENTDTEDNSNSSEYYDIAKAYWADCEDVSDIENYKVIWVKRYTQNKFKKYIFICRTILDENGGNDGIKVTTYDVRSENRRTVSEAKFLEDSAKNNELAEEIDWAKVVEFSQKDGDDIDSIPENSQISYEEASGGKGSSNKTDTTVETDVETELATEIETEENTNETRIISAAKTFWKKYAVLKVPESYRVLWVKEYNNAEILFAGLAAEKNGIYYDIYVDVYDKSGGHKESFKESELPEKYNSALEINWEDVVNYSNSEDSTVDAIPTDIGITREDAEVLLIGKSYSDEYIVRIVQEALNEAGYDCGTPDGIAGEKTKAAISAYKEHEGFVVDETITDQLIISLSIYDEILRAQKGETEASKEETSNTQSTSSSITDEANAILIKMQGMPTYNELKIYGPTEHTGDSGFTLDYTAYYRSDQYYIFCGTTTTNEILISMAPLTTNSSTYAEDFFDMMSFLIRAVDSTLDGYDARYVALQTYNNKSHWKNGIHYMFSEEGILFMVAVPR